MIHFEHVSFAYDANPGEDSLKDVTLTIEAGECVLLTGPSGCGKSTLLRLLNGLIPEFYGGKRTGGITADGVSIGDRGIYDLVGRIGTVFQNPRSQFFNVDTTSELAFGCENLALPEAEIRERIRATAERFGIGDLLDRDIFKLSGGEKQKIACASVDVLCPDIILLDEPSANLDYDAAEALRKLIRVWKGAGKTVLIAEHRIGYVWDLADRIVVLDAGRVVRDLSGMGKNMSQAAVTALGLRTIERVSPLDLVTGTESGEMVLTAFSYAYPKEKEGFRYPELRLRPGSITALVGANGAGKTTYLECLCGIRKNRGKMILGNRVFSGRERLRQFFLVMQDANHQLFTESVLEEVVISLPREDEARAMEMLQAVDLADLADRHPLSLSGGQKQRLAIACALASGRPCLLLDEPTSGLDLCHMEMVAGILKRLKEEGRTIITVTHDSEFIERCCDAVIRWGNGHG